MEKTKSARVLPSIGLIAVFGLIVGLIIYSMLPKPITEDVWETTMITGDTEHPKKHYIMYTDLMCPYCDVLARATMAHEEEFNNYLAENHILFEIRMTNFLYYNGIEYSAIAAEAAYCAAAEDQFWPYYHGAVQKLWDDYHSKGIGDSKTSPMITDMTIDWWLSLGADLGLSSDFASCVKDETYATTLETRVMKMSKSGINSLPFFNFNGVTYSGIPSDLGSWESLKAFLDTGLGT